MNEYKKYFRLKVPKRQCGGVLVDGGYDVVIDRDHIRYVTIRGDGAAYVYPDGEESPFIVYKDEADLLLAWMYGDDNHE